MRSRFFTSPWRWLYLVAWIVWIFDLATKSWAISTLSNRGNVKVLGDFLQLTFIRNSGAAFSIATDLTFFITLFAFAVIVAIAYYSPRLTSRWWALVLGLVLGGALGNVTDRIFRAPGFMRGHVIDWIQLPQWPVFNIADSAIVVAAGIAVALSVRNIAPISPAR